MDARNSQDPTSDPDDHSLRESSNDGPVLDGKSSAELLMSASHAMHSTRKLASLYELILQTAASLTGSAGAVLLVHRPRTHHPIIFKVLHGEAGPIEDLPTAAGWTFLEWVRGSHPDGPRFDDTPLATLEVVFDGTKPVGSDTPIQWVHLANRGRLLGVLGVIAGSRGLNRRVEELLEPLAEQATIALDNALLFRRAERESLENQVLLDSSRLLMSSLDLDEILVSIMDSLQKVVPYNAAGIFLVGKDKDVERIVDRGYDSSKRSTLDKKAGVGLVGWVASSGQALVIDDVHADPRYQNARVSTQSEMVVPIFAGDNLVGVFNLERDVPAGFFEVDLDLVHAFAQHAGVAIERARAHASQMEQRRIRGELEAARSIQKNFLPQANPVIPGFDIAGLNIPSVEVGGDYYDFIHIVDGQIGLAIADSSGKGIPAALVMAAFRASLIAEIRNNYALHVIMQKVNRLLCEGNEETRFVTAIYGVLDTRSRVFTFSNAGHNPGILRRADGSIVLLDSLGTALGLFDDFRYEERVVGLSSGDVLLLYTDGVTDVFDSDGEAFELDRIIEVLHEHHADSADEILSAVRDAADKFGDPDAPVDDFTMVAVRVL